MFLSCLQIHQVRSDLQSLYQPVIPLASVQTCFAPLRPVLFCPVLFCPVPSRSILLCPFLSCPFLSCSVMSCPVLSRPVPRSVSFCSFLICYLPFCSVLLSSASSVLFCSVLFCSVLFSSVQLCFLAISQLRTAKHLWIVWGDNAKWQKTLKVKIEFLVISKENLKGCLHYSFHVS